MSEALKEQSRVLAYFKAEYLENLISYRNITSTQMFHFSWTLTYKILPSVIDVFL